MYHTKKVGLLEKGAGRRLGTPYLDNLLMIKWASCSRDRAYDPCCGTENEGVASNKRTMSTRRWYRTATSEVSAR